MEEMNSMINNNATPVRLVEGYVMSDGFIIECSSGRKIPDIAIRALSFSVRAINALSRWGSSKGKLKNNVLMLSALLECTVDDLYDVKNLGVGTIESTIRTILAYLSGSVEVSSSVLSTEDRWKKVREILVVKSREGDLNIPLSAAISNERLRGLFARVGVQYISDLGAFSYEQLIAIPGLGSGKVATVISELEMFSSDFGASSTVLDEVEEEAITLPEGVRLIPLDPTIPVLADKYAVLEGVIVRRKDLVAVRDVPIEELELSVRGNNCMRRAQIDMISQLVNMPYEMFLNIRNLGRGTADEIVEKLDKYLETHTVSIGFEELVRKVPVDEVMACYDKEAFITLTFDEIYAQLSNHKEADVRLAIEQLVEEGTLVFDGKKYRAYHVSFYDALYSHVGEDIKDDHAVIIMARAEGTTLEDIAQKRGLTRERVRQLESNVFRKLTAAGNKTIYSEDYLAYLFTEYQVEKDLLEYLLVDEPKTVYYLYTRYKVCGERLIDSALEDRRLSVELRRRIEAWIYRGCFFYGGQYVSLVRKEIEAVVVREFCREKRSYDDFCERYNAFIDERGFSPEVAEKLRISERNIRSRQNRLAECMQLLWSQNQQLRYYDVEGGDYTELLEVLQLDQYDNIELSTLKFVRMYPDLMQRYDIRDEYELHNLLKKIGVAEKNNNIEFSKMPILRFGGFDRDTWVMERMFELAPISIDDFAEYVFEELGVKVSSVKADWFNYITEFYYQGMYRVDDEPMPDEHIELLLGQLAEDFYFFHEIKDIYKHTVLDADLTMINPYNIKRMGFMPNGTYAFRNYPSAYKYFYHLFTASDYVDSSAFHSKLNSLQLFYQAKIEIARDYEVVEYEPYQFINIRRLRELGIDKADLRHFCDEVYEFTKETPFFTMASLRQAGFTSRFDSLDYDLYFYSSILIQDPRFAYRRFAETTLFRVMSEEVSRENGDIASLKHFLLWYMVEKVSMGVDDLISDLTINYHIYTLDRWAITDKCHDGDLYYDRITDRVYVNYGAYCADI